MEAKKMAFDGEKLKTAKVTQVPQSKMTGECWPVQFWGFSACDSCEFKDTDVCGGLDIRKTGKNSKGHKVPIR